jgi:glycosyltransferase involved in cell wall biosynthesis
MEGLAVSVIIPTHNRVALLGRAVRSALAATSDGYEILIIDDDSNDRTPQLLREFRDRIRYIHVRHGGAGKARNRGIAEARCPLIALLDSDDEWMPDKLLLQRQAMQRFPQAIFCFSDFGTRLANGREQLRTLRQWTRDGLPWNQVMGLGCSFSSIANLPAWRKDFKVHLCSIYRAMIDAPYVFTDTIVVRRSMVGDALEFPEDQPCYEDYECFSRMSRLGEAVYLDCPTCWQWDHTGPRLTDLALAGRAACRLKMLRRVWGSDPEFLEEHSATYNRILARQHLLLARRALVEGRIADAKAELAKSGSQAEARLYRVMASLPRLFQGLRAVKHSFAG